MKKALILLVPALALLASCGDAIEIPDVSGSGNVPVVDPDVPLSGDVVFTGTIEDLPDGSQAVWAQGESILLSDGASVQTLTNRAAAGQVAEFPGKVTEGKTAFVAVYPAADGVSIDGTTVSFEIPTAQTAAGPAYKVAKASGTQLYFRSLVSVVNFSVGYEGVTKVRFQTTGGNIAGAVTADYAGETPTVSATEDFVEVTGAFQPGETYTFSALPGTYEGITIVAYSGDKATAHVSVGEVDLKKGLSVDLSALQQDIPTYRITNMWVCGGTGPEYGGAGVIDILTKTNYWNTEDGRGITALKDNYYQLRPDGTFVNYAGEDGRNWWFVYSGSVNPANGKDLDLRKFYDVLPLSEGRYALDGNTVTFTKADGSTTQALFVGPGTYEVPGAGGKSVTITRQALAFTITGGKDDWNNIYKDYDKIAARPRALFIEMEAMPDGFIVPEASRTTDADFEYVEPGSTFDWASLPGSWNVFGRFRRRPGLREPDRQELGLGRHHLEGVRQRLRDRSHVHGGHDRHGYDQLVGRRRRRFLELYLEGYRRGPVPVLQHDSEGQARVHPGHEDDDGHLRQRPRGEVPHSGCPLVRLWQDLRSPRQLLRPGLPPDGSDPCHLAALDRCGPLRERAAGVCDHVRETVSL